MKSSAKLSLEFDKHLLQKELLTLENNWTAHFNTSYYTNDWSGISLRGLSNSLHKLSAGNSSNSDFENSSVLNELPYTQKVLDELKTPKMSVRFLKLGPGSSVKAHKDYDLVFWNGFVRLHIPVFTNDNVKFIVDGKQLDMKPGECWFADFSKTHSVENNGTTDRIHLVIDCKVNQWLISLFEQDGIIQPGEQPPDQMDRYDKNTQLKIAEQLESMGLETSNELAKKIRERFN